MSDLTAVDLRKAIKTRNALTKYRDAMYLNMLTQLNTQCQDILKDDLGPQFVKSCGRDLAGEVVRNCFDTSNFYVTVDQLAMRIWEFDYKKEYDPLGDNAQGHKNVYNFNEKTSSILEEIIEDMDDSQERLFVKENKDKSEYVDKKMIGDEKKAYAAARKNEDGSINDEYTGDEGEYRIDKNGNRIRRLQVDHMQALATARYNVKYIKREGLDKIKKIYNSEDNFTMMLDTANQSKGDVKVFDKDGHDITHRATPEQYMEAITERWENIKSPETRQKLIDKGYLNPDGTVPKHIKNKLTEKMRRSQNAEGKVLLKNADFAAVGKDALGHTGKSLGKIIAGQIIYYVAPPLVFEIKGIIRAKPSSIETAIEALGKAGEQMGEYILSKLKPILMNVAVSSLKNFIKVFMDILINLVKGVIKKILKLAKNFVLVTVDAIRVLTRKESTREQKADAVCNLFGVTITTFVVDMLFEMLASGLHIPEFLLMPLQILATVVCTNLTMLILQKADLFSVRSRFKVQAMRNLFEESVDHFNKNSAVAESYATAEIAVMIEQARGDCLQIYGNIMEQSPYEEDFRSDLNKINQMFGMGIDFDRDWLKFLGIEPRAV